MDLLLHFTFRSKKQTCFAMIDCSAFPCYIFIFLTGDELIKEFGDEITIKTDGYTSLPKRNDYPALIMLRRALFESIKVLPEFIALKDRIVKLSPKRNQFETPGPYNQGNDLPTNLRR